MSAASVKNLIRIHLGTPMTWIYVSKIDLDVIWYDDFIKGNSTNI